MTKEQNIILFLTEENVVLRKENSILKEEIKQKVEWNIERQKIIDDLMAAMRYIGHPLNVIHKLEELAEQGHFNWGK